MLRKYHGNHLFSKSRGAAIASKSTFIWQATEDRDGGSSRNGHGAALAQEQAGWPEPQSLL